jgi:hypothetical protein
MISSGMRLLRRLYMSLVYDTRSNAPLISRLSSVAIRCRFAPYIVWILLVISCRAVSVDLIRRPPIWVSGRSACVSAANRMRSAITASKAFPRVLRRAIGRYILESE